MTSKLHLFLIVAVGYIFSVAVYLIWYFTILPYPHNVKNIVIVGLTVLYIFLYFLISSIRSFQKPLKSLFFVSTTTLLTLALIISVYYVWNQFVRANNKIKIEKIQMRKLEAQIDEANKSISKFLAKLEYERKENEKLREQLNEIIKKTKSKEGENNTKGNIVIQTKLNKDFSKRKINSETGNTDLDKKNQKIIFKVQIISSSTRLATNSPQFKDLKNVWEYKDKGIYKYTVGNHLDLKSASALQSEVRRKGFNGAFVVAFKNGKRITVRDAKKFLTAY
jgi:hypothetical protein